MIRTLIIEDETPAAQRLGKMLKSLDDEIEIVGMADTVEGAVKWLQLNRHPDLIMLDIQLGDGLSFSIFSRIKVESYVIFTTAYDEYAIQAFELNSIGYLLKPVDINGLNAALTKFRKMRDTHQSIDIEGIVRAMKESKERKSKRFVVNTGNRLRIVEADSVAYFYSLEKNTFLCTFDNRHYPLDYSLDAIEAMIDGLKWFRVNRSLIVSLKAIARIDIMSKSRIKVTVEPPFGGEVMVSGPRSPQFRRWLEG
jgi:two-component system LytT family response regulator